MRHIRNFLAVALALWIMTIPAGATELGVEGERFTLDGKPTFLLGTSYYGALGAREAFVEKDLDDMQQYGVNWFRVWATWGAFGNDVSAVDPQGRPRRPQLEKLRRLVAECDRRGMVVDVTLSRGNGVTGQDRLQTLQSHRRAVRTLIGALKPYGNWYIDLGNERNIGDRRHVGFEELRQLRDEVKRLDAGRLVTASHAGDPGRDDVRRYLQDVKVDFLSIHRPRNPRSPGETADKSREYRAWMKAVGRSVPLHYQEPFRRGFRPQRYEPTAEDFLTDFNGALAGGAAGWCLHNGDQKDRPEGKPRRSFDMRQGRLFDQFDQQERRVLVSLRKLVAPRVESAPKGSAAPSERRTRVSIDGTRWKINGRITYPGTRAEGLLMNVRMVNSIFEDRKRPEFDPDANTAAFLDKLPDYAAHGVRALTINLQGGMPGYEGAVNSALNPDGSLRESYLGRARRVIDACDRLGVVVILGCFYQRQDQILEDEAAVRAGVVHAARWVQKQQFTNVVLEIANEFPHGGFDHKILRTPDGEAELINLAKKTAPTLLISTSGIGNGRLAEEVARASDFLLIHFNGVSLDDIPRRIKALKKFGKPIVCNEDDKQGKTAARAAELSVANGASWGLMLNDLNQYQPFVFRGAADDPIVYAKLKSLTR
ncbi:MAG: hypothetical protein ACYSWU_14320 [Planctomycetota bacterium]|jgi:hypothetical protein